MGVAKIVDMRVAVTMVAMGSCSGRQSSGSARESSREPVGEGGPIWEVVDGKGKVWTNASHHEWRQDSKRCSDASAIPAGAEVIDLSRYSGLTGFIDVHTHMTMYTEEALGVPMQKQTLNAWAGFAVLWRGKARCDAGEQRHDGTGSGLGSIHGFAMRD